MAHIHEFRTGAYRDLNNLWHIAMLIELMIDYGEDPRALREDLPLTFKAYVLSKVGSMKLYKEVRTQLPSELRRAMFKHDALVREFRVAFRGGATLEELLQIAKQGHDLLKEVFS